MHWAFLMELNMGLDTHCNRLFWLGLCLELTGGGRLWYWQLLPKKEVAPGSQSSWIVLSRCWSGLCFQQHYSLGARPQGIVCMLNHVQRAQAWRLQCHILGGNQCTEIVSLRVPMNQLGPEMIGILRCIFSTSYLWGPKRRCSMCNGPWIGHRNNSRWR